MLLDIRTEVESNLNNFVFSSDVVFSQWRLMLFALQCTSCCLRLDTVTAVRVAVDLCLGPNLCVQLSCYCGMMINGMNLHSFQSERSPDLTSKHQDLNDLFVSSGLPLVSQLNGQERRSDGLNLISWKAGKKWQYRLVMSCPMESIHSVIPANFPPRIGQG